MIETIGPINGELIIQPESELSYATYREFFKVLKYIEDNERPSTITIDLQHTKWIDSMGLGLLYNLHLRWRKSVHNFKIINATQNTLKTLKTGHLNKQYTIAPWPDPN